MKKILIVANGKLIINGSGGHTVMCGLVEAALNRNIHVTYLGILPEGYDDSKELPFSHEKDKQLLVQDTSYCVKRRGTKVESYLNYFDHSVLSYQKKHSDLLTLKYDALIAFDSLPIGLSKSVNAKIKIAILGDPVGDRFLKSKFMGWNCLYKFLIAHSIRITEKQYYKHKLKKSWIVGMFGTGHSKEWSKVLRRPIMDLRPFLPSSNNIHSEAMDLKSKDNDPLVIVFGGTLATTASRLAFEFMENKLIPELQTVLGKGNFIFKFVGSYPDFYKVLTEKFPEVVLTGNVPVFESELATCDVFVLPMKYPVGVRTRICSALQAGCYCICDSSVTVNMPELKDCETVKISENITEYVQIISKLPKDLESKKHIKKISRAFFNKYYSCEQAAKPILDTIEGVV